MTVSTSEFMDDSSKFMKKNTINCSDKDDGLCSFGHFSSLNSLNWYFVYNISRGNTPVIM